MEHRLPRLREDGARSYVYFMTFASELFRNVAYDLGNPVERRGVANGSVKDAQLGFLNRHPVKQGTPARFPIEIPECINGPAGINQNLTCNADAAKEEEADPYGQVLPNIKLG